MVQFIRNIFNTFNWQQRLKSLFLTESALDDFNDSLE